MGKLTLPLRLGHFKRARIDLRQKIDFLYALAFLEADAHEFAVDLGLHRHGRNRGHRAKSSDRHVGIAGADGRDADRLRCGLMARARLFCRLDHRRNAVNAKTEKSNEP